MHTLLELFSTLNEWYWFSLAAVLIILEMLLGTNFFLLWTGISAACVGGAVWLYPGMPWEYQFVFFSIATIACLVFWNLHLKHQPNSSSEPNLNRRSEQYVGRVITLTEPIVNGRGKIHIDDSFWRIEGHDLPAGAKVKVVGVDGVVLKVKEE